MNRVGIDRPLWDTGGQHGDRRAGLPQVVPDPRTAATYVARTYLDSVRLGIARALLVRLGLPCWASTSPRLRRDWQPRQARRF